MSALIAWWWHRRQARREEHARHEVLIAETRRRCGCWVCELGWGP